MSCIHSRSAPSPRNRTNMGLCQGAHIIGAVAAHEGRMAIRIECRQDHLLVVGRYSAEHTRLRWGARQAKGTCGWVTSTPSNTACCMALSSHLLKNESQGLAMSRISLGSRASCMDGLPGRARHRNASTSKLRDASSCIKGHMHVALRRLWC